MKVITDSSYQDMVEHWQIVERIQNLLKSHRKDIIAGLDEANWLLCIIEEQDLDQIFNISSGDWIDDSLCTLGDFMLAHSVQRLRGLDANSNKKVVDIWEKVHAFANDINAIDRTFIYVAESLEGPYTIIEGNKRSVALAHLSLLAGSRIYLGIMDLAKYKWASQTP